MKVKVLRAFVYEGKDYFKGNEVEIKDKDFVALARRGLVEIIEKKKKDKAKDAAAGK